MRFAIIALIVLFGLGIGVLIYRILIHSSAFARLINGVLTPTPETTSEVIERLKNEKTRAKNRAGECRTAAKAAVDNERILQRELGTSRRRRR